MRNYTFMIFFIILTILVTISIQFDLTFENKDIAEDSTLTQGIINVNYVEFPVLEQLVIESYYDSFRCFKKLNDIVKELNEVEIVNRRNIGGINQQEQDYLISLGLPFDSANIVIKNSFGEAVTLITGEGTCSENIIFYNLCKLLQKRPQFCDNLYVTERTVREDSIKESNSVCYECCNIVYEENFNIVNRYLCGPICGSVPEFIRGKTFGISRECLDNSCNSESKDLACCTIESCVDNGDCFSEFELSDVDANGQKEICFNTENSSFMWVDPDNKKDSCKNPTLHWINNTQGTVNSIISDFYDEKNQGYCCGDDSGEQAIKCKGSVCTGEDFACCNKDQCAYDQKCYSSGCTRLKDGKQTLNLYCDGEKNRWYDLDEDYCELCIGSEFWSGSVCCGDDKGEGVFHTNFTIFRNNTLANLGYSQCTIEEADCTYPLINTSFQQGCFFFDEKHDYLKGNYYCKDKTWYDPDLDERYCSECEFGWIQEPTQSVCCGDDLGEHHIFGTDGTQACCKSDTSCVVDGECVSCEGCGNTYVEGIEECELPQTINNKFCSQIPEECLWNKLGVRDFQGDCNSFCSCVDDPFNYSCVKDKCGAECNQNGSGCDNGEICNTRDCTCYGKSLENITYVNESIDIDCPYIIDVNFDQHEYHVGDTTNITVKILDKKNKLMPSIKFFFEFYINNEIESMNLYSTPVVGMYDIKKYVTNSTKSGKYKYLARVYHTNCPVIGDSAEANFIVPLQKNKQIRTKSLDIHYYETSINLTEFNPPITLDNGYCGDSIINIGEVCEGSGICRNSIGCNYNDFTYDTVEYCSECACAEDEASTSNGEEYCSTCGHCGDGKINCNEECEPGSVQEKIVCRDGTVFKEVKVCNGCKWATEDVTVDLVIENCWCDYPTQPTNNCKNGDYVRYKEDYNPGCSKDSCVDCFEGDIYTKDSNMDGIEDKCSPEICNNKFDDNDNGLTDEDGCIWFHCSDCGHDYFNLCDKRECLGFEEGCFFENFLNNYGFCYSCSLLATCEDYSYDQINCEEDPCGLKGCTWNNISCCTDLDNDNICDYIDNCLGTFNPNQKDLDNDGHGDDCELCINESNLIYPIDIIETECDNGVDDDCDNFLDCSDEDCTKTCVNDSLKIYTNYSMNITDSINKTMKNETQNIT